MENEKMTKEEQTRRFQQDFLWGLNHLKVAHDPLMETAALRYLEKVILDRVKDLNDEAILLASDEKLRGRDPFNPLLMHEGSTFKLNVELEVVL